MGKVKFLGRGKIPKLIAILTCVVNTLLYAYIRSVFACENHYKAVFNMKNLYTAFFAAKNTI